MLTSALYLFLSLAAALAALFLPNPGWRRPVHWLVSVVEIASEYRHICRISEKSGMLVYIDIYSAHGDESSHLDQVKFVEETADCKKLTHCVCLS